METVSHSPVSPRLYHDTVRPPSQAPYAPHEHRSSQPPTSGTPSRAADPMSLKSIMSGPDTEPPTSAIPQNSHDSRRVSQSRSEQHYHIKPDPVASPRPKTPLDNHINVIPKAPPPAKLNGDTTYPPQSVAQQDKNRSLHDERDVEAEYAKIDSMDLSDVETPEFNETRTAWKARSHKRALEVEGAELAKRKRRRTAQIKRHHDVFTNLAMAAKDQFNKTHEQEAWQEVQQKEIQDEKE
ncbi:hypothetical protein LTS18_011673, partial [Coniosporium uncinatum]